MFRSWFIAVCLILYIAHCQQVLSTVDIDSAEMSGENFGGNFAGVSLNYSQLQAGPVSDYVLQEMLTNSYMYGDSSTEFWISVKNQVPVGFKYDCDNHPSSPNNANGTTFICLDDISDNLNDLSSFFSGAVDNLYHASIGYDMQETTLVNTSTGNFTQSTTGAHFQLFKEEFEDSFWSWSTPEYELFDMADKWPELGIRSSFTPQDYSQEVLAWDELQPYLDFYGPGITQDADPSWGSVYANATANYGHYFTVRCIPFKNESALTEAEMLNEQNYAPYINQRFTFNGTRIPLDQGRTIITDLRMTDGLGVQGVTNGFVSALWALDFGIEFANMGGHRIQFMVDFERAQQSPLSYGVSGIQANPMYYAMLMMGVISKDVPQIGVPDVTAGTSANIKAYTFEAWSQSMFLILNKDTDPTKSGIVNVAMNLHDRLECIYLTAPSLNSTSGVTFAGYYFEAGSSSKMGSFQSFPHTKNDNTGFYEVPLNYSQAVLCYHMDAGDALTIEARSPLRSFQSSLLLSAIVLLTLMLLLAA